MLGDGGGSIDLGEKLLGRGNEMRIGVVDSENSPSPVGVSGEQVTERTTVKQVVYQKLGLSPVGGELFHRLATQTASEETFN